jgi:hypothetical protein
VELPGQAGRTMALRSTSRMICTFPSRQRVAASRAGRCSLLPATTDLPEAAAPGHALRRSRSRPERHVQAARPRCALRRATSAGCQWGRCDAPMAYSEVHPDVPALKCRLYHLYSQLEKRLDLCTVMTYRIYICISVVCDTETSGVLSRTTITGVSGVIWSIEYGKLSPC